MKARNSNYYTSTKFVILTDSESVARARRHYLTWILIVTLAFCITAASLSYKIFIAPIYFSEQTPQSTNNDTFFVLRHSKDPLLKFYNPVPLLARLRKRIKDGSEFVCGEYKTQETIPSVYTEKIFQNGFEKLNDYINLDLLLHYDNIINKYSPKTLKLIFNEYQLKLLSLKKLEDFLLVLKSNKFKFYAIQLKQQKFELKPEDFESYFVLTNELNHWYNFLDRLRSFLLSYEGVKFSKYFDGCDEKNFEKFTKETQQFFFHFVYPFKVSEKKLLEINEIINEWAQPLKTDFNKCSITFYNQAVALSDVNEKILGLNISCLKNVYVFASNTIYLDADLELFGVNLAIIAPKWVFLKKIKINLNGHAGKNHTNEISYPLQSGAPGNPGGNAGDFLGVGNFIEKFLIISVNGGKGGKGQNGAKGHDGFNNTRPGPPVNKPACVIKINAFNNTFGETIIHYEIYNETGCGGSGTDGGIGGVGGAGGVITLINKAKIKIARGLNGTNGTPGKGGAGGVGGQNGCFYEVLDIDDEVLHPVTRIKCPIGNTLPSGTSGKDNHNFLEQILPPPKEYLDLQKCLLQFIRFAADDFTKHNDANLLSFVKDLNQQVLYNNVHLKDVINEYKILKLFDRSELYNIFSEKINYLQHLNGFQPTLKYLKSIVLGKMLVSKENVDFFFIDLNNYLKFLRTNIINTNMNAPEMHSLFHLKKKVGIKCEQVKLNLKLLRKRLIDLYLGSGSYSGNARINQTRYLSKTTEEKRILCAMITTVDVYFLINRYSNDKKFMGRSALCSYYFENKSKIQDTIANASIGNAEKILFNIVENLENEKEVKEHLTKLRDALCLLKESVALSNAGKNLLEVLTDELEHFIALYYFTSWEGLESTFSKSLNDVMLNKSSTFEESSELEFLKSQLVDVVVAVQYKLAVNAARQRFYPYLNSLQLLQKETTFNNILSQLDILQDIANQNLDSFCKNQIRAVFNKDSAVGEFYFWSNSEIKSKLKSLFSGAEISLKANLINHHVFDKNFIQFTSLKLEFECSENRSKCEEHMNEAFLNFNIEITHSGYSYYNWNGETHNVLSEKVKLSYSFKMRDNKDPEVYNSLFKKCQNGEISLSPFTTWTIRLFPLNEDADFTKLEPFADFVNLRLIGTGTYISE